MFQEFSRKGIKFLSLSERKDKISKIGIFEPGSAGLDRWLLDYWHPDHILDQDLQSLAEKIVAAKNNGKPVIWMMGAHVIRRGNSLLIIDLMERGIITHIAANGAVAIHDFELAFQGSTCEDVEHYIKDGKFGNWKETGFFINNAVADGYEDGLGYGAAIGRMIEDGGVFVHNRPKELHFPFKTLSIFAAAYRLGVPITVHKGIGQDITDQHPDANFEILGGASGRDFLIFVKIISKLEGGGVFLNLGTQVMGPEVYLKTLSMARNVAAQENREIKNFTTAVFDIVDLGDWRTENSSQEPAYYFRPKKTILIRTVKDGGESFYIRGDFDITIPALYKKIVDLLQERR
ncbi:MAG: hypothetical protein Q7R75_02970 [bacterium]|nr:hypothetical protein [bacterium]